MAAAFDVTNHAAVNEAVGALDRIDIPVNNAGNGGVAGIAGRGVFAESDRWVGSHARGSTSTAP